MSNESAQTSTRPGQGPANTTNTWFQTLNELYRVNEHYIQEVIDSSRKILQTVLDGLVPEGRLRHAPIRTFFRILSGMIFILKVQFLPSVFAEHVMSKPLILTTDIHTGRSRGRRPSLSRPAGSNSRSTTQLCGR